MHTISLCSLAVAIVIVIGVVLIMQLRPVRGAELQQRAGLPPRLSGVLLGVRSDDRLGNVVGARAPNVNLAAAFGPPLALPPIAPGDHSPPNRRAAGGHL